MCFKPTTHRLNSTAKDPSVFSICNAPILSQKSKVQHPTSKYELNHLIVGSWGSQSSTLVGTLRFHFVQI